MSTVSNLASDGTDAASAFPERPAWSPKAVIEVGIVGDNDMFALGIKAFLAESPLVRVSAVVDEDIDVLVVVVVVAARGDRDGEQQRTRDPESETNRCDSHARGECSRCAPSRPRHSRA